MRAINHALTGALIGFSVNDAAVAIPVAVASHYICDAIPHHGFAGDVKHVLKSKIFRNFLYIDAGLCGLLVLILAIYHPPYWQLADICAFFAASPDFLSINHFRSVRKNRNWHGGLYAKFASGIQWFEKPIGAFVELAWFAACVVLIVPFIKA